MTAPQVLALIPARGGSKSVPRKNLLPVGGRPLIEYSIRHALSCPSVTRTIVSTDDAEIAAVSVAAGAEVPFRRPSEFASDTATDFDVFRHALAWLAKEEGALPELVVHLRPTGPVRDLSLIERAVALMLRHPEADSLRSVGLAEQTPYKMWTVEGERLQPLLQLPGHPEAHSMPRQKLPRVYWQNGYVDIVRPRTVLELNSMVGYVVLPFIVEGRIVELDYPDQIPELERAVLAWERGEAHGLEANTCPRHPA